MLQQQGQANIFYQDYYNCLAFYLLVDKNMSYGNSMVFFEIGFFMFAAIYYFLLSSWIVIGFGLDCQSILKSGFGFGFSIAFLYWIWIVLTIQKDRIEQKLAGRI
jgi:hypothetical protein